MFTDPIADYLTRIRNAVMANQVKILSILNSRKDKKEMFLVLSSASYNFPNPAARFSTS